MPDPESGVLPITPRAKLETLDNTDCGFAGQDLSVDWAASVVLHRPPCLYRLGDRSGTTEFSNRVLKTAYLPIDGG
jgi:hypothetical protein